MDLLSPTLSQDYFQKFYRLDDMPKWYAGGFNVAGHQPNWSKWQLMDLWSIEETTCISIGFEPEKMPKSGMWSESPSEPMIFYWDRMEQIGRADVFDAKHLNKVNPTRFIQWALKRKLDIPTEFAEMFDSPTSKSTTGMLKTVDAREHDSALKIILAWMAVEYGFGGESHPQR